MKNYTRAFKGFTAVKEVLLVLDNEGRNIGL
jgi:hypothetical protein